MSAGDALRGQHLHLDPLSGIAGDMTVAALVHAGVPASVVTDAVAAMRVPGLVARFETRKRGAFVGTGFDVTMGEGRARPDHHHGHDDHHHGHDDHHHGHDDHHHHEHRRWSDIRRLIGEAALAPEATALAERVFERIAQVEAGLHGVAVDDVAFHEVGAWDSIADVVGAAAALAYLAPASVSSTPPVVGTGRVRTAHGPVAVPAPATASLLAGVPILPEGQGELTTPTGAAILATIVQQWGPAPPMIVRATGYGAGTRELADRPNVLRVLVGSPLGRALPAAASDVLLLQANLDDMSPQLVDPLFEALFAAGALDVWCTPIVMKKGRPAFEISALAPPQARPAVERAFFLNAPTLGVRAFPAGRTVLGRALERALTPFGEVTIKVASLDGAVVGATPEFEDCRALATAQQVPVRDVLGAAAVAAARWVDEHAGGRRPRG